MIRILFVDDTEGLRRTFRRQFSSASCAVEVASDAEEALELLELNRYDAVFSDYDMPGMTGNQLLERVADRYPATRRVMISGSRVVTATAVQLFLSKPWSAEDVNEVLEQLKMLAHDANAIASRTRGEWDDITPIE